MKVLVKKSGKANWNMTLKCTGYGNEQGNGRKGNLPCGSALKIDADDIFLTFSGGNYIESGDIIHYTCKCPECGSLTDIKGSKLPEIIKEYAASMHYKKENETALREREEQEKKHNEKIKNFFEEKNKSKDKECFTIVEIEKEV